MNLKRGLLLVILFLIVLVPMGIGQGEGEPPPDEWSIAEIYINYGADYTGPGGSCDNSDKSISGVRVTSPECDSLEPPGCRLYSTEGGFYSGDSSGCARIIPGLLITRETQENLFCGKVPHNTYENPNYGTGDCKHVVSGGLADCLSGYNIKSNDDNQYLCSSDGFWKRCSPEDEEKIAWADNILYSCTIDEDTTYPVWKKSPGSDADHDTVTTTQGDCDDNPTDDPPDCPTDLTEEICSYPQHSKCAICIHPGAPEVCGDGIGDDSNNDPTNGKGNDCDASTPDDCNNFPAGCENREFDVARGETGTGQQYNVYDEKFSWVGDTTGSNGQCCGIDGVEDLGSTADTSSGEYLCLNKNLVGVAGGDPSTVAGGWGPEGNTCMENWCWVSASSVKHQVYTIREPIAETYDIVSNGQKWNKCSDTTLGPLDSSSLIDSENVRNTNRFYCYDEGNRFSFADCVDDRETREPFNSIKSKEGAEGTFSLILSPEEPSTLISSEFSEFEEYYKTNRLDVVEYDFLEMFLQFTDDEIVLPAEVKITIFGPEFGSEQLKYLEQNVLSYAIGNPLLVPRRWIRARIPITDMYSVEGIKIESLDNMILVKNLFFSKEGEKLALCSGRVSGGSGQNAWLDNFDFYETRQWNAEQLCNKFFDPHYDDGADTGDGNAWLGDDLSDPDRRCCGNDLNEYYAGLSDNNYGCWNSLPVASGETTMNVKVEAEYTEKSFEINYPKIESTISVDSYAVDSRQIEDCLNLEENLNCYKNVGNGYADFFDNDDRIGDRHSFTSISTLEDGMPPDTTGDYSSLYYVESEEAYYLITADSITDTHPFELSLENSPIIIGSIQISIENIDLLYGDPYAKINPITEPISAFFVNSLNPSQILGEELTYDELSQGTSTYNIIAEVNENYQITTEPVEEIKLASLTFSCSSPQGEQTSECLFPLPGEPPYKITNPHPELYELSFVVGPREEDQTPITTVEQEFAVPGMLKAKKVAQQIIFVNEGEDATEDPSFFGCQAASFVEENLPDGFIGYGLMDYCSSKANTFCSYSKTIQPGDDPRERYTTINTWSDEQLPAVGYDEIGDITGSAEEFLRTTEFPLRTDGPDLPVTPDRRNYSTSIVPGRNMLSNAQFQTSGTRELPHWEAIASDGTLIADEENYITAEEDGNTVNLPAGIKLRSEKVAIPRNAQLHFSQNLTCQPTIILIDKDGAPTGDSSHLTNIETGEASYAIVEFTGPCTVKQPFLQLLDDLGPASYKSLPIEELSRAGAACCPDNYCWNGYACIAPMGSFTYLAEHIEDGRDYRCINGEWNYQPVKFDWNRQQWGFCQAEEQCFVLSSTAAASPENSVASFYNGDFPTCIENSDYILDNYCNNGNWTSRTQFVANQLLEVAGDEDYILYCTNYKEALLSTENFGDKDTFLGGPNTVALQEELNLEQAIAGQQVPEVLQTCFSTLGENSEAQRLVEVHENTCINNVCVLIPKNGKVAFGTTLNRNLTDPNSFLLAFNVPQHRLQDVCQGTGGIIECDLSEFGVAGNFWYLPQLSAVVYSKEGISLAPSIVGRIIEFFRNFLGLESELSDDAAFIQQAENFREVYLLNTGEKKVRAVKEILSQEQQTLAAEYEGFTTPICSYVQNLKVPPELRAELLEQVTDSTKLSCTQNNSIQRVEMVAGVDFFWPQLTGRLRVG